MDGIIIFDHLNDVVFKKLNAELLVKLRETALSQELISADDKTDEEVIDNNVIIQLFSPITNSQRIMFCQFDNTYTSFQCENDLNFVFDEFLGYLFLKIGSKSLDLLRRDIAVSITIAKHICGPDLYVLKQKESKSCLMTDLLETWQRLYETNQGVLLEAIEQLMVNPDVKSVAQKTLEAATERLKQDPHSQRSHALLFVENKFLGIYSSRQAQKVSSADILFLSILCQTFQSKMNSNGISIQSNLLFLRGQTTTTHSSCIPHIVHTSMLDKGAVLMLLIEYGSLQVASGLHDTFHALQKVLNVQAQADLDNFKSSFENLETHVKQSLEALRKAKYNNQDIENCTKRFILKWENLKRKYAEFFKSSDKDSIVKIESNMPGFADELQELFRLTCLECAVLDHGFERVSEISTLAEEKLLEFSEFLSEFPGLVHFIHIDRSIGRIIAPDLPTDTPLISREKVWSMVEFTRSYLTRGHMSLMWKDTTFNYSYFLWFEDQNGAPIKPKDLPNYNAPNSAVRPQFEPGILGGDYYQRLLETCFPKASLNKIKCFEVYCIHLGLVTATCALEHCRRLVATINDIFL
ncbi:unnamed protein product [Hermetia illucens]|uniref:Hermansky-Pudlak syndrome 1 n=1 Tax=Hermetia illucens TaxID=343691 RepID=A0A7R8YXL1_HERIL|nr:unnamed protein product [Hermetia illucens]